MNAIACTDTRTSSGMFYQRYGAGPADNALVLCHGLASNASRWRELAKALPLPSGWLLLCPDLRGHGRSQWRGKLDRHVWGGDLAEMLDTEGIEKAVIGGHCMGANLALHFARNRPERCCGLILIEPMLAQARVGRMRIKTVLRWILPAMAWSARLVNALGIRRGELPVLDLHELDRKTRQAMEEQGSEHAMTSRYASPLPDLQYLSRAAYFQALCETLKPVPPLSLISQPSLGLISSGGMFGDPELTRRALAEMPDCRIETLAARHWIPTEQPEQMRELIGQWLLTRF